MSIEEPTGTTYQIWRLSDLKLLKPRSSNPARSSLPIPIPKSHDAPRMAPSSSRPTPVALNTSPELRQKIRRQSWSIAFPAAHAVSPPSPATTSSRASLPSTASLRSISRIRTPGRGLAYFLPRRLPCALDRLGCSHQSHRRHAERRLHPSPALSEPRSGERQAYSRRILSRPRTAGPASTSTIGSGRRLDRLRNPAWRGFLTLTCGVLFASSPQWVAEISLLKPGWRGCP
jgi:hypothetical protein